MEIQNNYEDCDFREGGGHLGFGAGFGEVVLFGDQFISILIIESY